MGLIWFLLLALGLVAAAMGGDIGGFTSGAIDGAASAITLAIGLAGMLALWMGVLRVAEEAGLTRHLAALVRPVMCRLFPDVPRDHPAMSAMVLNVAANMLGLGNAATPFGLKAMEELQTLNPRRDTATDSMILFLVINASSVQLVPATVVALRTAGGAADPTSVVGPTLLATAVSTTVGVVAAKLLARARLFRAPAQAGLEG
ncbi:nucleoside recognition domain-containing protein [Vulgatibacter incomptus]|uniref:nucleoside recognition domain-containing protein n=1 Tax=Vulgatibacter incomptus TaxID=1391653 RepID=UPI0006837518|nr:nucleoside recognition domain-containing protein [Vulgatibacter incomptus]